MVLVGSFPKKWDHFQKQDNQGSKFTCCKGKSQTNQLSDAEMCELPEQGQPAAQEGQIQNWAVIIWYHSGEKVLRLGVDNWEVSSVVGQWCFNTLHLGLYEIFNILLGLALWLILIYKLDMLVFIMQQFLSSLCAYCAPEAMLATLYRVSHYYSSPIQQRCHCLDFTDNGTWDLFWNDALWRGRLARQALLVLWLQSSLFCCSPRMFGSVVSYFLRSLGSCPLLYFKWKSSFSSPLVSVQLQSPLPFITPHCTQTGKVLDCRPRLLLCATTVPLFSTLSQTCRPPSRQAGCGYSLDDWRSLHSQEQHISFHYPSTSFCIIAVITGIQLLSIVCPTLTLSPNFVIGINHEILVCSPSSFSISISTPPPPSAVPSLFNKEI